MTEETRFPNAETQPTPPADEPSQPAAEGPSPEAPTAPVETETLPPPPPAPEPATVEEPRGESRVRRFFRRLLWTLAFAFALFAAGFLTAWYAVYQPAAGQLEQARQELQTAQQQQADLEVKQAELEGQLSDAQARIADLEGQLEAAQAEAQRQKARVYVLSALADTYAAKLSLERGETATARLYLANAKAALTLLHDLLPDQEAVITEMKHRIDQALGKLDTNPLAAQGDMDVVTNGLVQLEKLLVGE